jgi:3',5'-cyclic AMP phosphodiesterase CpdA
VASRAKLRIAHLSDLHFLKSSLPNWLRPSLRSIGLGEHEPTVLNELLQTLTSESPDIIIVTGDVTSLGDSKSMHAAEIFLQTAVKKTGATLIVVPGNHDSILRNLGFGKRRPFNRVFRYKLYRQISVRGCPVHVFSFDSNRDAPKWPLRLSQGHVSRKQFTKFNRHINHINEKSQTSFDRGLKISLVHHHPLPIPHKDHKSFTVMRNGGTFIAHMQGCGMHLVLHGHEHCPYSCTYQYDEKHDPTVIVAAGSASQVGGEIPSFNVIDVIPWEKLVVRQFHYIEPCFLQDFNGTKTFYYVA